MPIHMTFFLVGLRMTWVRQPLKQGEYYLGDKKQPGGTIKQILGV